MDTRFLKFTYRDLEILRKVEDFFKRNNVKVKITTDEWNDHVLYVDMDFHAEIEFVKLEIELSKLKEKVERLKLKHAVELATINDEINKKELICSILKQFNESKKDLIDVNHE